MHAFETRHQKILNILLEADDWVKADDLAAKVGLSDKTIRTEISSINQSGSDDTLLVVSQRGKGYRINPREREHLQQAVFDDAGSETDNNSPFTMVLLRFLVEQKEYLSIDEIADQYYRSNTTMRNELHEAERFLTHYQYTLKIASRKGAVRLEGEESEKRSLIQSLIEFSVDITEASDIRAYASFYPPEELQHVQEIIRSLNNQKYDISLDDTDIMRESLRLLIAAHRLKDHFVLSEKPVMNSTSLLRIDDNSSEISGWIWSQLSSYYHISAPEQEVESTADDFIMLWIKQYRSQKKMCDYDKDALHEYLELVRCILYDIKETYLLDLTGDTGLIEGLTYHLLSWLERIDVRGHASFRYNPLLETIKDHYPYIFEIAIYAGTFIGTYKKITLNEDEIGYLAIHFGTAMETIEHQDGKDKINTAFICNSEDTSAQFALAKLRSSLDENLYIKGPYLPSQWNQQKNDDVQLIISTVILPEKTADRPTVIVNPVLRHSDIDRIGVAISKLKGESVAEEVLRFIPPEMFVADCRLKTPEKIIHFAAQKLKSAGIVTDRFEQLVMERENVSSTAMQNSIAIPHPLMSCASKSAIVVLTLPRAVNWYGRKAQLLFFAALKDEDRTHLQGLYKLIMKISDSNEYLGKILKASDYQEFRTVIEHIFDA